MFDALFFLMLLDEKDIEILSKEDNTGVWSELFKNENINSLLSFLFYNCLFRKFRTINWIFAVKGYITKTTQLQFLNSNFKF